MSTATTKQFSQWPQAVHASTCITFLKSVDHHNMRMTKTLPQNSEKNVMYVSVVINSFFLGIDLVCHLIFA